MPEPFPVLLLVPLPEPDVAPPLVLPPPVEPEPLPIEPEPLPIEPEPLPIEPDVPLDVVELEPDFLLFDFVLCEGDADVVGAFVVDEPFPVLDADPELVCALAIAAVAANATATAVA